MLPIVLSNDQSGVVFTTPGFFSRRAHLLGHFLLSLADTPIRANSFERS